MRGEERKYSCRSRKIIKIDTSRDRRRTSSTNIQFHMNLKLFYVGKNTKSFLLLVVIAFQNQNENCSREIWLSCKFPRFKVQNFSMLNCREIEVLNCMHVSCSIRENIIKWEFCAASWCIMRLLIHRKFKYEGNSRLMKVLVRCKWIKIVFTDKNHVNLLKNIVSCSTFHNAFILWIFRTANSWYDLLRVC